MAKAEITDQETLEKWLKDQPSDVAVVIAARSALRVLPLLAAEFDAGNHRPDEKIRADLILSVFRAVAVSWFGAVSPNQETEFRIAASDAAFAVDEAKLDAAAPAFSVSSSAAFAAFAASDAADAAFAVDPADAAFIAFTAAADAFIWDLVQHDVDLFEKPQPAPAQVAFQALWSEDIPEDIAEHWNALKKHLLDADEGWQVWTEWYDARLAGGWTHPKLDEKTNSEIETARVLIDKKLWQQGPVAVNAEIRRIINDPEHRRDLLEKFSVQLEPSETDREKPTDVDTETDRSAAATKPTRQERENVRTHPDDPAVEDLLNRRPFAAAVVEAMNEVRTFGGGDGFAVHLHGPWGSGKTSILNFMADYLTSEHQDKADRWIVVKFNAWENERINPPWWPLLQAVHDAIKNAVRKWKWIPDDRRQTLKAVWCRWMMKSRWWPTFIFAAFGLLALALLFNPWSGNASKALGIVSSVAAVVALFNKQILALVHGSSETAVRVQQLSTDTMKPFSDVFAKLIEAAGQPVAIFIDDLDRCNADYAVDLLEGIQTLFRHSNVAYVVAADRKWIRSSFENRYKDFAGHMQKAGQPLGYLFLEKIFQISTSIPGMGAANRGTYWQELLSLQGTGDGGGTDNNQNVQDKQEAITPDARNRMVDEAVREERQRIVKKFSGEMSQANLDRYVEASGGSPISRAAAALELSSSPSAQSEGQHMLEKYLDAVPENPRGMKRMVNAFGLRRAIRMLEANPVSLDVLTRWTIIEQRWPELADELIIRPALIDKLGKSMRAAEIEKLPDSIRIFANDGVLHATLNDGKKRILKEEHVRLIAGL